MGGWLEEEDAIKNSATQFFQKLFTSERQDRLPSVFDFQLPCVSQEDNDALQCLPALEEVKDVVFSLSSESAPGPDGFGVGFYQTCWQIIGEDLVDAVQEFFQGV